MKQIKDGIWSREDHGTINIGFTREFIQAVLTECYHITQASSVMLVKDRPMLTIETNEGLKVIRSPVTGTVTFFSTDARDFPDRLGEETIVLSIRPKSQVVVPTEKKPKEKPSQYAYFNLPLEFDDIHFGDGV